MALVLAQSLLFDINCTAATYRVFMADAGRRFCGPLIGTWLLEFAVSIRAMVAMGSAGSGGVAGVVVVPARLYAVTVDIY